MTKNIQKNKKYTEILKLAEMLKNARIPFGLFDAFDGYQIIYYGRTSSNWICSAIEFTGSYGAEENLIEIMGLVTPEEDNDDVLGRLTAENVFNRIAQHWKSTD